MIIEAVLQLANRMAIEERTMLITHLLTRYFVKNEIDVALALYEKKFQLETDDKEKEALQGLIKFLRELAPMRPHVKEISGVALKYAEDHKGCQHG